MSAIDAGMQAQLHIGAQLFVWHKGRTVVDVAVGEARPGVRMTTDTLMLWLSATKPITALAARSHAMTGHWELMKSQAANAPYRQPPTP